MAERDFHLSRPALVDLGEIEKYLAERSPSAADRVVDALFATFRFIAQNPESGTRLESFRPGLKMSLGEKPADKLVVFYYIDSRGVFISRILHSARNWTEMIGNDE
ncbi:MAG: type II toxin-antitoxin system RelE/ParE family toxin [Pirellulales bacterium]